MISKLMWNAVVDERANSRKQVITRTLDALLEETELNEVFDNFYSSEIKWIRNNYPELEIIVGAAVVGNRLSCVIRKKD